MATTKIVTNSTWQLAATSTQNFIIDNASSYPVQVTFSATTPSTEADYHTLLAGQAIVRMDITGGVYVRDATGDLGLAFVIVTV